MDKTRLHVAVRMLSSLAERTHSRKSGLKTSPFAPKHPSELLSSAARAATPESPEAKMTDVPCIPSFMNSTHCLRWYAVGMSSSCSPYEMDMTFVGL